MSFLFRQRLLVFIFPLLLAAPFLNRAFFVDDNYFVEIATWLKAHPALPYHFLADDAGLQNRGWEKNGFVRMVNPLVHHYYLALLLKVYGSAEWFLRLGCTFLSCFSALFIFEFARRWTNTPLLATLLVLVTPVQWLGSYSLLIDPTMAFFAFGALYFFIRSTEVNSLPLMIYSGLFMGLAVLSKYTALFIFPLTAVWMMLRWKKIERRWLCAIAWGLGLVGLVVYNLWTAHLYGRPHLLAASARMVHVFGWAKVLSLLVFFSGSLLLPLVSWQVVNGKKRLLSVFFVLTLAVFFASAVGGFSKLQGGLLGLWLVTSFLFLGSAWGNRSQWIYPRDHFLFMWVAGFLAMMLLVMDWVAARYYCLVAPAAVLMSVRLLEMKGGLRAEKHLKLILAGVFIFTALLAFADYKQAEPSRRLKFQLKEKGFFGGDRHFYLGDSFTMGYLRAEGWVPCFPETQFQPGDWILAKEVTMPLIWFAHRQLVLREIARFDYPSSLPLKVMDYKGSAGFYASVWGALPFTFSTGPWERFHLFEIIEKQ